MVSLQQSPALKYPATDLNIPYLTKQLIAYIGNKRSMLGFLYEIFKRLGAKHKIERFLDPFAGSGAVSRLAKVMGFETIANDWEFYSYLINYCHIEINVNETDRMFLRRGGLEKVIEYLNTPSVLKDEDKYISKYYAPSDTFKSDYKKERLFYTAENALRIDAARNRIEEWYPGFDLRKNDFKEKSLLLGSLLYKCATNTNTSGVFKAYHRGFGGFGRDALKRIMAAIKLDIPVLYGSAKKNRVYRMDAAAFLKRVSGDLCYIDPPYNQHQYGSNYHLLNTIALWDRREVPLLLGEDGRLKDKAGIRRDWKKTKSKYCYRDTAVPEFKDMIESVDARFIVLSYNSEGIVPFDTLLGILENRGKVEILTNNYTKYKGGKQSINRENHNMELVIVTDTQDVSRGDRQAIRRVLLIKELNLLLKRSFYPRHIEKYFVSEGDYVLLGEDYKECSRLYMPHFYRFPTSGKDRFRCDFSGIGDTLLISLIERLKKAVCTDRSEEIDILIEIASKFDDGEKSKIYQKRILQLLKKIAFKKYRNQFSIKTEKLKILIDSNPVKWTAVKSGIPEIERIASLRFTS